VTGADFRGLRKLKEASGKRFVAGIYDGEACASFGDGMFAVPLRALWGNNITAPSLLMISWWIIV